MSSFGERSLSRLTTCHAELQEVCFEVIPFYNFTIIWGRRGEQAQNLAYSDGYSTKPWPESNHNAIAPLLSEAVDIAPWFAERPHIRWDHELEFVQLSGYILQAAASLGVELRYGGDWDSDRDLYDFNKPFDLGHFERVK
jgi:peptidoglycan L-alanyl-D-glutamate endopeptidase CwlK